MLFPPAEPEGHPTGRAGGARRGRTRRDNGSRDGPFARPWSDGESGYVLDDPVPGALADRIDALLSDDELRGRLGRAARQRHLDLFTQEAADRALAAWLQELL